MLMLKLFAVRCCRAALLQGTCVPPRGRVSRWFRAPVRGQAGSAHTAV